MKIKRQNNNIKSYVHHHDYFYSDDVHNFLYYYFVFLFSSNMAITLYTYIFIYIHIHKQIIKYLSFMNNTSVGADYI